MQTTALRIAWSITTEPVSVTGAAGGAGGVGIVVDPVTGTVGVGKAGPLGVSASGAGAAAPT